MLTVYYTTSMVIYFSGIGGVGIGPLAEIAHDVGYEVVGSDAAESLMTKQLGRRGIEVEFSQNGEFLKSVHESKNVDWFVYTAALPDDHPELAYARENGIRLAKRDELLLHIIQEKNLKLIGVSGTHGKTTTTGMMIWAMKQLGVPVSYSIGTTLSFGSSGKYEPGSEYFIYECDEFDRNMLQFSPYLSIVTNVGYDHKDTYETIDDYKSAFRQFIHQSEQSVLWQYDANLIKSSEASSWCLQSNEVVKGLKIAGEHNRRNATLVLKALERLEIGEAIDACQAIESFPGTNRRFEKVADNLYSDYGHHPIEIAATLQMASEISDNVVLVYQPHQNIRQHEVKSQYANCFKNAAHVYWLPTYLSREDPDLPILTPQQLSENVKNKQIVEYAALNDELWHSIQIHVRQGHLVLCMGAGSIDNWLRSKLIN